MMRYLSLLLRLLSSISITGLIACGLGACGLGACSPADLLNATVPSKGYHVEHLAYGKLPRQSLDLYIPDGPTKPVPVIVFFYGGRWETGDKETYRFAGEAFASRGFVAAIPDYRLYPEVKFPTYMDDAADAFVWVSQHVASYGGDPDAMFVAGHSAGGQLAALLALDPGYLIAAGGDPSGVKGLIGLAGPYDFLPLTDGDLIDLFSVGDIRKSQAIDYANGVFSGGRKPPSFLALGDEDTTVKPKNSYNLAAVLKAGSNEVEVKTYPGIGHIGLILSLAGIFRSDAPLLADITDFVRAHSGGTAPAPQ